MKKAVAIGNFDAVHCGHFELVQTARELVGSGGGVEIWSFYPPPVSILAPEVQVDRLTTFEQRSNLLIDAGADKVRKIVPSREFLSKTPEDFIAGVVEESSPDVFVEGEGFRFGKDRTGTADTLRFIGERLGFSLVELGSVIVKLGDHSEVRASSSMVRTLLKNGRVEDASIMLGREVQCSGIVTEGDQRGQAMGTPTANLTKIETMMPRDGIYAGTAIVDGETYIAAISIGTKPTFGKNDRVLEAHLIAFDGVLHQYGWPLTVTISHWIREQVTFDSIDALRIQIESDIQTTIKLIESNR